MNFRIAMTLLALSLVIFVGCGGDDDDEPTATQASAVQPTATATVADEPTATVPAEPTPTEPAADPTSTEDDEASGGGDDELIEQGRVIFEETAGGIGCAACHGMDAKGDPTIGSADIRGANAERIQGALASVDMMSIIELTDEEIDAVAAYLATLE